MDLIVAKLTEAVVHALARAAGALIAFVPAKHLAAAIAPVGVAAAREAVSILEPPDVVPGDAGNVRSSFERDLPVMDPLDDCLFDVLMAKTEPMALHLPAG